MSQQRHDHAALRNRQNKYRGGWSSSIVGVFDDPSRRSSACALSCCGILLSDRNAYLLDNSDRPNWRRRRFINCYLPIVALIALGVVTGAFEHCDPYTGDCEQDDATKVLLMFFRLCFWALIIGLLIVGKLKRSKVRMAVLQRLREERGESVEVNTIDADTSRATGLCCCYPNDVIHDLAPQEEGAQEQTYDSSEGAVMEDLCTCLFKSFSNCCCGAFCACWCQCCGMCAVAQEDREIQRLLKKEDNLEALQIDYITFQNYSEYYPSIQQLQRTRTEDFPSHFRALSQLSKQIVKYFFVYLAAVSVFSVLSDQLNNYFVLLATYAQAFILLYFVYWKWYRLDISLDAVIKCFASGFVLSTCWAVVVETLLMIAMVPFAVTSFAIEAEEEAEQESMTLTDFLSDTKNIQDVIKHHLGVYAIGIFFLSFVVAAFVEELCKYFGFWMVETPDLMNGADTKARRAAAITIAMVATATGFACKENVSYVFSQVDTKGELLTLLARSLLPVHPICAAIQSIGVVRRDVEGDSAYQLGRIILPAIMLHGLFDFVLMLVSLVEFTKADLPDTADPDQDAVSTYEVFKSLLIGMPFVVSGLVYYYREATSQRHRLDFEHDEDDLQSQPEQQGASSQFNNIKEAGFAETSSL